MKLGASEAFMQQVVEVINEGLLQDRIVKIKGFGTFKLQEVKERNSVNVNTGEKVVIAAHDKIIFTPDNVMRDMINKPFAHFETVIVDGDTATAEKKEKEEITPVVAPVTDIPAESDEQEVAPVVTPVVAPVADIPTENGNSTAENEPAENNPVEEETEDETLVEKESNVKLYAILACVIMSVLFFAIGYFAAQKGWFTQEEKQNAEEPAAALDTTATNKTTVDTAVVNTEKDIANTTADVVEKKSAADEQEDVAQETYNADPRVKYGAYTIIGTETEVKVLKGQTLKGISKAYLGPEMECYVEAYNNKKDVKEGDVLLIPKLKIKKRK